ncbi:aminotransferase class I/II-fold pyridoxal phosphate-dependent enzyme [Streptomyces scopuliridis]|uniref:Aminotransferase class I/II-fold pyridoxal phosphate-dependent enzyme n=1 Tax=Streptomyces scopuliridis TaxID=452529 RepID=A0ACD4ZRH3_9ACTN|nr:aminotransferase class I/II-fold pyridoxal phosphate-dependent enzyme [Streptomyces scopuliridis]WSB36499.1 aminotransferase class I/II-fold pyridoxal phosphate-dependent enzyme [Streptomyces scopuliridis]WSC00805.1 aminotransferase class I/II-fold pyridoxal phosphate-dependent enzyme [Streptomyces scopuliridis]WSC05584.1 aminotransferase class I/II-fold pyridoxal phosphate-dependent enzyme [Streptomyces scopuliridis]
MQENAVDRTWAAGPRGAARLAGRITDTSARGVAAVMTDLIRSGELAPGSTLPTVRALAAELGVSPGTVADAWAVLRRHRMITTLGRRGSVVSGPPAVPHPVRFERVGDLGSHLTLDLAVAAPDPALLPALEDALLAGARSPRLNDYSRSAITAALLDAVQGTWPFEPEAWMAVGGGYEGVQLLCQALIVPGDRVAVEDPTAARLLDILEALDAQIVPVACDAEGPLPDSLARALEQRPALFLHQSRAQAPCGWTVGEERAAALAAALEGAPNVLVLEDDGIGPVAMAPAASIGAHLPGRTVLVRSYSKSYGPDLRIAVVGGPKEVVERARVLRTFGTGWTSRILQDALAYLLTDDGTTGHVRAAARRYDLRRTALATRLAAHGVPTANRDGLMLWVPVVDETSALVTLAARGVTVSPGSRFCVAYSRPHVRIATSRLTEDPHALDETASLIALAASASAGRMD